jgi:hypothetical protein
MLTTWIITSLLLGLGFGASWATKDKKLSAFTIFIAFVWLVLGLRLTLNLFIN